MDKAAFQVIVLGPTGGPKEDAVTGLLVRSTSTKWSKGSIVAVDAGTLLSGIVRILEQDISVDSNDNCEPKALVKQGPFTGMGLPHMTAHANAAYVFREIIASVLITHPHLDHMSGLAINTPLVEASNGPKTVAALPSAISAMKNHMFNDVIWPNLSDEDGGAGLITYQRLVEGGNPRFGRGESRGYVRACEGLVTKCLSISHGRCKQQYHDETGRHHRVGSAVFATDSMVMPARALSIDHETLTPPCSIYSPARSPHIGPNNSATPAKDSNWAVVESSAFFLRDDTTGNEIIIFGDIEPDSVSLEPRNKRVWEIAAPKIASGSLQAIFIECSYNDAIDDETLYGHLCPRHLIAELKVLAAKVTDAQNSHTRGRSSKRKRKDSESTGAMQDQVSPRSVRPLSHLAKSNTSSPAPGRRSATQSRMNSGDVNMADSSADEQQATGNNNENNVEAATDDDNPGVKQPLLTGLSVYIIHIKDTLTDGPHPSERILGELRTHSEAAGLGCEFFVPKQGEGIWI
ncbi:cAMP phosphodiesterases class-II-domain-containing protein [Talaromyces proteolyticus]|uniref:cAMP phosphodiesterases class-II-domain-containing protein n=1 Tax=Talaromyces proteolyticus TaxID=1131652 RepID=A0AAD4KRJ4_9EURO|nr:cAMP phosphodiesterases class-II-domain-containing protein [Talaromyces proteolyticus]KAH8698840.1 cAMP phosphodiesterases class-II-domain-containing protein [Talaromyces proteolyticus]